MQVILREVVHSKRQIVYGVTIPKEVAMFFQQVTFNVERSGNAIILASGTSQTPTKQQVKEFEFKECRL